MTLPASGVHYLDANALIYLVEDVPPYNGVLRPFWTEVETGHASIVTSALAILETTVRPLRDGNSRLVDAYQRLLTNTGGVGSSP